MLDTIARVRQLPVRPNPGCTTEQLNDLAAALATTLPAELMTIYKDHNGMADAATLPFRLMSVDEVKREFRALQAVGMLTSAIRAFWTDDRSNFAGLYVTGPLAGKLCFLHHEATEFTPVFRSIPSFYQAALAAAEAEVLWFDMKTDYPVLEVHRSKQEYDEDLALALGQIALYQQATDAEARMQAALCAMNLLPLSETYRLLDFVWVDDMWIQERACDLLGQKKFVDAVPTLAHVVRVGSHNGRIAALQALGRIGTRAALEELIKLATELDEGWDVHLAGALENCGCEVVHDNGVWRYRLSSDHSWRVI